MLTTTTNIRYIFSILYIIYVCQVWNKSIEDFISATNKTPVRGKYEKMIELKNTRHLFGRLLYISRQEHVDIPQVVTYPLI